MFCMSGDVLGGAGAGEGVGVAAEASSGFGVVGVVFFMFTE